MATRKELIKMHSKVYTLLAITVMALVSAAQAVDTNMVARLAKTGGLLIIPASGKVAMLNCQSKLSEAKLQGRCDLLGDVLVAKMKVEKCDGFSMESATEKMQKSGANVAVFVVEDAKLPMSLVAMEEAWAMINMSKVADGSTDEKIIVRRFGAELNRVVRSLLSAGDANRRSMAKAPRCGKDLDAITNPAIPMDAAVAIHANMPRFGVKGQRRTTYKKACIEGWAPMPTNEYQRAIWEQTHAVPKNPMQIKFDPKTGK